MEMIMGKKRLYVSIRRRKQVFIQKLLLTVIAGVITLGFGVFLSEDSVDAHTEEEIFSKCKYYTSIEITSGDSLWSIAERYVDENYRSIGDYIDELKAINNLKSNHIQEGQYLTISYYGY